MTFLIGPQQGQNPNQNQSGTKQPIPNQQGGFGGPPTQQQGGNQPQQGGFNPQQQGGFNPQQQGSFNPQNTGGNNPIGGNISNPIGGNQSLGQSVGGNLPGVRR